MMAETPRPWPPNAQPTPEQLMDWLYDAATRDERLTFATRALEAMNTASRCFMENHDGLLAELRIANERAATAYSRGRTDALAEVESALGITDSEQTALEGRSV